MTSRLRSTVPRDVLVFADDDAPATPAVAGNAWLVLIVDDEEEVHRLTRFVLADLRLDDRPVTFLSAYSATGAEQILRDHPEVAVVLLDVVMEREDAGLRLVRTIREELGNQDVRIILRTGQPGQAPPAEVIARHDINGYRCKADLTAQQLQSALLVALRNYRDIQTAVRSREGMRRILAAGSAFFAHQTGEGFADQVLGELLDLLAASPENAELSGLAAATDPAGAGFRVRAVRGKADGLLGRPLQSVLPPAALALLPAVLAEGRGRFTADGYLDALTAEDGPGHVIWVRWRRLSGRTDRDLIRVFMANAALGFRNLTLRQEIVDTQKEIIHTLSDVLETRSSETANHVLRVGLIAAQLGELAGLPGPEVEILRMAAPMHDVGKVGIPDAVLNKPGRLDADERRLIETHATIGHSILARSERRLLRAAAVVAQQHHERWDGGGYPAGLAGEDIHPHARITALADVFDALTQDRVYRAAMPEEKVLAIIAAERGGAFEPALVDLFLAHRQEMLAIRRAHPDALSAREGQDRPRLALADQAVGSSGGMASGSTATTELVRAAR